MVDLSVLVQGHLYLRVDFEGGGVSAIGPRADTIPKIYLGQKMTQAV